MKRGAEKDVRRLGFLRRLTRRQQRRGQDENDQRKKTRFFHLAPPDFDDIIRKVRLLCSKPRSSLDQVSVKVTAPA